MNEVALKCSCGAITGKAINIRPGKLGRVVCCCGSCQEFARFLEQEEQTLDKFGGTELVQLSQAQVVIENGKENLKSLRVTPKGIIRWYAGCCNTPIANTVNASMPFAGVLHNFINTTSDKDSLFGPITHYVQCQDCTSEPDYPNPAAKFPLDVTLKIIGRMIIWKVRGLHKPSVFFNDDGNPVSSPKLIDRIDRTT